MLSTNLTGDGLHTSRPHFHTVAIATRPCARCSQQGNTVTSSSSDITRKLDIHERETPYYAGFGLRYFTSIPDCLTKYGGVEWLEVVHPTKTRPLDCLRVIPRDSEKLCELWG